MSELYYYVPFGLALLLMAYFIGYFKGGIKAYERCMELMTNYEDQMDKFIVNLSKIKNHERPD